MEKEWKIGEKMDKKSDKQMKTKRLIHHTSIPNYTSTILFVLLWIISPNGYAFEADFYTYNTFTETVDAFTRLALVFGDSRYTMLYASVAVLGILLSGIALYGKGLMGQKVNPLSFAVPLLIGLAIYQAFILPKDKIHVYDKTINASQTIEGVPNGLIFVGYLLNSIERILIEIVDSNSANPWAKYETEAGGISFKVIEKASKDYKDVSDSYLTKSIKQYYLDCGLLAIATGRVDVNEIRRNTTDMQATIGKFESRAIKTRYYTANSRLGTTESCTNAFTKIKTALDTVGAFDSMRNEMCAKAGFDVTSANQLNACKNMLAKANTVYGISAGTDLQLIKNLYLADVILDATMSGDADSAQKMLANRNIQMQSVGMSNTLNEWMPKIRAWMLTAILGLIPIIAIFMVTPLFFRALSVVIGLLLWYTIWSVIDVIMHESAVDVAMRAYEQIKNSKAGLDAIWLTPEASTQALGVFGQARTIAFGLSGVVTSMLFKMSIGSTLANAANHAVYRMSDVGAQAAHSVATPEGQGGLVRSASNGIAGGMTYQNQGLERMVTSSAYTDSMSVNNANSQMDIGQQYGHDLYSWSSTMGAEEAASATARASVLETYANMKGISGSENIAKLGHSIERTGASQSLMAKENFQTAMQGHGIDVSSPEKVLEAAAFSEYYNHYDRISRADSVNQSVGILQDYMSQRGHMIDYGTLSDMYRTFAHGENPAKVNALQGNASDYDAYLQDSTLKNVSRMQGEVQGAENLNTSPQSMWQDDGRTSAAQTIGRNWVTQELGESEIADDSYYRSLWNNLESQQREQITQDYFQGDPHFAAEQLAQLSPNSELAQFLRMERAADLLHDGNIVDAQVASQNAFDRRVVSSDKLMEAHEADPNLFKFNDDQLRIIGDNEMVQLHLGMDPQSGSMANVSVYSGTEVGHRDTSSVDLSNRVDAGDNMSVTGFSAALRSNDLKAQHAAVGMISNAYNDEQTKTELVNELALLHGQQVDANSIETLSLGYSGGISGGTNMIGPVGLNAEGNIGQQFNDNTDYDMNYANSLNAWNQFDEKARLNASSSEDAQEQQSLWATAMFAQLQHYDYNYQQNINAEANNEKDGNEAVTLARISHKF